MNFFLADELCLLKEDSDKGGLPRVDMTNDNYVDGIGGGDFLINSQGRVFHIVVLNVDFLCDVRTLAHVSNLLY